MAKISCNACKVEEEAAVALASSAVAFGWFVATLSGGRTVTFCPRCAKAAQEHFEKKRSEEKRQSPPAAPPSSNVRMVDSHEEQVRLWVAGESTHARSQSAEGYQCCPDFSCCRPSLRADEATRRAFEVGSEQTRNVLLASFLGALLKSEGINAHVTG